MTTTESVEDLLRDALDRLFRQEKRTEALEAVLFQLAPQTVPVRDLPPPPDTVAAAADETKPQPRSNADSEVELHHPAPRPADTAAATVVASLDDVVWSISPDGEIVFFVAGAVDRTFGRGANGLRDTPGAWLDTLPPDDRHALRAALARLPATDVLNLEHRVTTPGGATRWLHTRGRLVRDADGRPQRVHGISTDITPRVRTRRGLFAVLEGVGPATGSDFLEKLVRHLADGVEVRAAVVAVPDAPHLARTLAVSIDRRLAANFVFDTTGGLMEDVFAGGSHFVPADARDRFPTDELLAHLRAESVVAEPLIDADGRLLGTLALIDDRPASPDVRAVLRALAPRVAAELAPPACRADLNAAVRAAAPMIARIAGRAALDITLPPVVPLVRGDANAASLCLLNLVTTAPDTGTITVRTAAVAGGVALTVTHTGVMADDVRARVLEQVRAAGGAAEIDSSAAWGTSVRVTWPAASPALRLV